ncbi:MAG: SHOCT domain-containing protein [Luteimonas sp.]
MTNAPLTSGEQARVFLFILLMIPTIPFVVGVLPVLFLVFGVALLKKNQDFSAIETSSKLVLGYLWIGLLIAAGFVLYYGSTYGKESATWSYSGEWRYTEEFIGTLVISAIIIAYIIFVHTLFLSPLKSHRDWVALNGIFSKTSREESKKQKGNEVKIIKGENMRSYSVADELSKWAKLRDEGVVSEQEFQEARNKILQSQ